MSGIEQSTPLFVPSLTPSLPEQRETKLRFCKPSVLQAPDLLLGRRRAHPARAPTLGVDYAGNHRPGMPGIECEAHILSIGVPHTPKMASSEER